MAGFANGKEMSVYVGKFRPKTFGYAEFYTGKSKSHIGARNLVVKSSKIGDRVIIKDGLKVVKTGRIGSTGYPNMKTGKVAKTVFWDK